MPVSAGSAYLNVYANLAPFKAQMAKASATVGASSNKLGGVVAAGAKTGTLAVAALGAAAVGAAASFESSFAEVRKTVDTNEKGFRRLERGLRNLSKTTPIAVGELAELAGQAGALGVKEKDLISFTKTAAELGIATDMSASEASNALARLSNIMGTSGKDTRRLASTFVELGNKGASTEAEISEMALRVAGAGRTIGLSEAEVLGLSSALANVGIKAEAGGSAISRVMLNMNDAIASGGKEMQAFADISGVSVDAFAKQFEQDAPAAIATFAQGLGRMNKAGEPIQKTLEAVGLNEIRVRDSLLRLSGSTKDFTKTQSIAAKEWRENNALTDEAAERSKTTAAQWQLLKNRANDLFITLGQYLLPVVNDLMGALGDGAEAIGDFIGQMKQGKGTGGGFAEVCRDIGDALKAAGEWLFHAGEQVVVFFKWIGRAAANTVQFVKDLWPIKAVMIAVKLAMTPVVVGLRTLWNVLKAVAKFIGTLISEYLQHMISVFRMVGRVIGNVVGIVSNLLRGNWADAWRNAKELVGDFVSDVIGIFKALPGRIWNVIKGIAGLGKKLGEIFINGMVSVINRGIEAINSATPGEVKVLGETIIPAVPDIPTIPMIGGAQRGGIATRRGFRGAGGRGGVRDSLLALLEPGELVIPRKAVEGTQKAAGESADILVSEVSRGQEETLENTREWSDKQQKTVKKLAAKQGEVVGDMSDETVDEYGVMRKQGTERISDLAYNTVKDMTATSRITQTRAASMREGVSSSYRSMRDAGVEAIDSLMGKTNSALKALGVKALEFGVSSGKNGQKKRRGGVIVPGYGAGDHVPILAEPGEVVWSRKAVERMGGAGRMAAINDWLRRTNGYAAGGIVSVPGFPGERMNSKVIDAHTALSKKYKLFLTDAYGSGHASSEHTQYGTAADYVPGPGGSWALVTQAARAAVKAGYTPVGYDGLNGTEGWPDHGPGNHVHIVYLTAAELAAGKSPGGAAGAVIRKLARQTITGPSSKLRELAQASSDTVWKAANRYLSRKSAVEGPEMGGGPMPTGDVRDWLTRALKITGLYSAANLTALYGRAMQESGGNPRAINNWDSNAAAGTPSKGLLQTIDPTFNAYKLGKYGDIWNPVHNAIAAIRYMMARYGHIVGPSGSGYRLGGIVRPDFLGYARNGGVATRPGLVHVERGETMTPAGMGGKFKLVITNWDEGIGYIERVADGAIGNEAAFQRQIERMGRG